MFGYENSSSSSVTIHYSTGDSKTFRGDEAERKMNAILGECARIERSMKIEKILKNGT